MGKLFEELKRRWEGVVLPRSGGKYAGSTVHPYRGQR